MIFPDISNPQNNSVLQMTKLRLQRGKEHAHRANNGGGHLPPYIYVIRKPVIFSFYIILSCLIDYFKEL